MSRKIYVVGGSKTYANWMMGEIVDNISAADIVVFTGGEDVSPWIYNEPQNPRTYTNPQRDERELKIFKDAVSLNKGIIGICRGAQLVCAASGGRLIQDQENPSYIHDIITSSGIKIPITSTHHQAMYPYDMPPEEYEVLAHTWGMSKFHEDGEGKEISKEPFEEVEICYFPKTKALGIQGHPESMNTLQYFKTFEYLENLLDKYFI